MAENLLEAKLTEDQELALEAVIKAFEMRRLLPRQNPMRRRVEALHEEFKMLRKCRCRLCSSEAESTAKSRAAGSAESTAAESPAKRVKLKY